MKERSTFCIVKNNTTYKCRYYSTYKYCTGIYKRRRCSETHSTTLLL